MAKAKNKPTNGLAVPTYQVSGRIQCLTFKDTPWEGAEVTVRLGISMDTYLNMKALVEQGDQIALVRTFGDGMLVSWNLAREDGSAFPASGSGMTELPDIPLALNIVERWMEAVGGVPPPLAQPSHDGDTLVAASTAMGTE